jgi:hypothetical protein
LAKIKTKTAKKTKVAPKIPAKEVLEATVPPEIKASKKELAQEALDLLGAATPSVTSGGGTVRWISESAYNAVNSRLASIIGD